MPGPQPGSLETRFDAQQARPMLSVGRPLDEIHVIRVELDDERPEHPRLAQIDEQVAFRALQDGRVSRASGLTFRPQVAVRDDRRRTREAGSLHPPAGKQVLGGPRSK